MATKAQFNLSAKSSRTKAASKPAQTVEDTQAEQEGDEVLSSVPKRGENKNNMLFIVVGIIGVVVIILGLLLFAGKKRNTQSIESPPPQQDSQQVQQPTAGTYSADVSGQAVVPPAIGAQDFTQNTTMSNSDVLTNPDRYVQDLYGLSTRVDYTVDKISYVADFVTYTKHRGTWGGGLELYWLDAEYKGNKYVVQVPFKYYKELDETGIVPVKMEVLSIKGSTPTEVLTVVSYMSLDEKVLQDILKAQSKS